MSHSEFNTMQLKEKLRDELLFNEIVIICPLFILNMWDMYTFLVMDMLCPCCVHAHACLHEHVIVRKDENQLVEVKKFSGFSL